MLEMQTCFLSEVGGRSRNEDACGYWTSETGCCWVVSDGAGGHGSGDVAARLVVSSMLRSFSAHPQVGPNTASSLLQRANDAVVTPSASPLAHSSVKGLPERRTPRDHQSRLGFNRQTAKFKRSARALWIQQPIESRNARRKNFLSREGKPGIFETRGTGSGPVAPIPWFREHPRWPPSSNLPRRARTEAGDSERV